MTAYRSAFTLVELMAVVTLLAIAVGVATVGLRDLSDEEKLSAAAGQLAAIVKASHVHTMTSGRPAALECAKDGCRMRRAMFRDGQWRWESGNLFALDSGVRIAPASLGGTLGDSFRQEESTWTLPIRSADWTSSYDFQLSVPNGRRAMAVVRPFGDTMVHWENSGGR
jgi:prepilin-type N-terminal cleavage/methylation domain-containing protein